MAPSKERTPAPLRNAASPGDIQNHLLRSMSLSDLDQYKSELICTRLLRGRTLYRPGDRLDWLYFPENALLSVSAKLRGGGLVETNVVGREGAIGLLEASARGVIVSHIRVHAAGDAWRASSQSYRDLVARSLEMMRAAQHHAESIVAELRQSIICHTLHNLDQRLCRWVLERHDHLGGEALHVTQACLADLLGAQRTSVSEAATRLSRRGLIRSGRAKIFVLDREGLEAGACECRVTIDTARRAGKAVGPHLLAS